MKIDATKTLADLAIQLPNAALIFEKYGLDYQRCGASTLQNACAKTGLNLKEVVQNLKQAGHYIEEDNSHWQLWQTRPLIDLIFYICNKHHSYTGQQLARLEDLLIRVDWMDGVKHPQVKCIKRLVDELTELLFRHMTREEDELFPQIIRLEMAKKHGDAAPICSYETILEPIGAMMREHFTTLEMLDEIRDASSNYSVPAETCASYKILNNGLEALDQSLRQHIFLEDKILFPRAIELENALKSRDPIGYFC